MAFKSIFDEGIIAFEETGIEEKKNCPPTSYTSIEQQKEGMREIPFQEPKATNRTFGVVKPGNGLTINTSGILDVNLGVGLGIDPISKKIIIDSDFHPRAGDNLRLKILTPGVYRYDVISQDVLRNEESEIPTSNAVKSYFDDRIGSVSEINSNLEKNTIVDSINELLLRSNYKHTQDSSSNIWEITHPLKRFPSVTIIDRWGQVVIGNIEYISDSKIKVSFTAGFSGSAYLN